MVRLTQLISLSLDAVYRPTVPCRFALPIKTINQDLGCLRSTMGHGHIKAVGILQEEASACSDRGRDPSHTFIMIRITLPKNLYRAFPTYDIHLSPNGVIENVVGITDSGQRANDSSRTGIQNNQPGGYPASGEKPLVHII